MDTLQNRISPRDAGVLGVQFFREVMPADTFDRVLLEGLELDEVDDRWEVTVGFDTFRATRGVGKAFPGIYDIGSSSLSEMVLGKTAALDVVREFRTVYLKAADGSFVKMDNR